MLPVRSRVEDAPRGGDVVVRIEAGRSWMLDGAEVLGSTGTRLTTSEEKVRRMGRWRRHRELLSGCIVLLGNILEIRGQSNVVALT